MSVAVTGVGRTRLFGWELEWVLLAKLCRLPMAMDSCWKRSKITMWFSPWIGWWLGKYWIISIIIWFHCSHFSLRGQKPSYYIRKDDVSHFYSVGDAVKTIYGTGIIQSIRSDGVHVITVQSWKLANNTSPTLYLQANALTKEVCDVFYIFHSFKRCFLHRLGTVGEKLEI